MTNLWLTESGEKSITKFGDKFVDHRIWWLGWWLSMWQTYHTFRRWLMWNILRRFLCIIYWTKKFSFEFYTKFSKSHTSMMDASPNLVITMVKPQIFWWVLHWIWWWFGGGREEWDWLMQQWFSPRFVVQCKVWAVHLIWYHEVRNGKTS